MIAPKFAPVCVVWLDAHSDYDDANSLEYERTWRKCIRKTIGWLIHHDKDRIVVAMDDDRGVGSSNDCQTVTTIPAVMIQDLILYKPLPKPKKKKPKP